MVTNIKPCKTCNDFFAYYDVNEELCTKCFIKKNKTTKADRILIYTMFGVLLISIIIVTVAVAIMLYK
jgi:hypothetical protein